MVVGEKASHGRPHLLSSFGEQVVCAFSWWSLPLRRQIQGKLLTHIAGPTGPARLADPERDPAFGDSLCRPGANHYICFANVIDPSFVSPRNHGASLPAEEIVFSAEHF